VNKDVLLYDLSNRPASFDIVTCISGAIPFGIKHVRFVLNNGWKKKNYTIQQAEERFRSIVEPSVKLFGLDYSIGDREGVEYSHFFPLCYEAYKRFGRVGIIHTPIKQRDYVTVTLRKSRNPERDSKEDEWLEFADMCDRKVIIIRDYEERPISLEDRMELYAGAYMNMMVINGPLTLCIHSGAPYISMRTIGCERSGSTSPRHMQSIGITPGFQFPWAGPRQRLSYLDDTAENIWKEYKQWA
jgi:hypothetical protein